MDDTCYTYIRVEVPFQNSDQKTCVGQVTQNFFLLQNNTGMDPNKNMQKDDVTRIHLSQNRGSE